MSKHIPVRALKRFTTPLRPILMGTEDDAQSEEQLSLTIEYDSESRPLREVKFDLDGEAEEIHSFFYDQHGHLCEHKMELPQDAIYERFITTRNPDGNPLLIIKYYGEDSGEKTEYTYGSHTQPLKIVRYDADGEFDSSDEFEYDADGRMVYRKSNSVSEGENYFRFNYNEKGWLTEESEWNEKNELIASINFSYTDDGKESMVIKKNGAGKTETTQISEFDEAGRLIRRVSKGFYIRISGYNYDETGRLIEETLSDENGFVISRKHTSYDEEGLVSEEIVYETDLTRSGRDTHLAHRYEYELF